MEQESGFGSSDIDYVSSKPSFSGLLNSAPFLPNQNLGFTFVDGKLHMPPSSQGVGFDFVANSGSSQLQQNLSVSSTKSNDKNPSGGSRKIIHRDIERQRRQEMASLCGSLRSQIPLEYLKGKRSFADQVDAAVKFIDHTRNKVEEMNKKRDELRKELKPLSNISSNCSKETTKLQYCHSGFGVIEVGINTAFEEGLPLSRVIQVLTEVDLNVVNCTSTKVNDRLLHHIESQVLTMEMLLFALFCY